MMEMHVRWPTCAREGVVREGEISTAATETLAPMTIATPIPGAATPITVPVAMMATSAL